MKTILHSYCFNTNHPAEKTAWEALKLQLKGMGLRCHETWSPAAPYACTHGAVGSAIALGNNTSAEVELETKYLFDDQWNSAPIGESENGYRLMDWALDYRVEGSMKHMKAGYWLEQTDEMRKARAENAKCGYCGEMYDQLEQHIAAFDAAGSPFCIKCIDSEYLKRSGLHLLRLLPAGTSFGTKRAELSDAEAAILVPRYINAQVHGSTERGKARIAKARKAVAQEYAKTVATATIKRDGQRWLLDNLPSMDSNAIYYNHTGRWGFGWRNPLALEALPEVLDALQKFPFPYDLQTVDGRKLSPDARSTA
jgi:hypothetical protein